MCGFFVRVGPVADAHQPVHSSPLFRWPPVVGARNFDPDGDSSILPPSEFDGLLVFRRAVLAPEEQTRIHVEFEESSFHAHDASLFELSAHVRVITSVSTSGEDKRMLFRRVSQESCEISQFLVLILADLRRTLVEQDVNPPVLTHLPAFIAGELVEHLLGLGCQGLLSSGHGTRGGGEGHAGDEDELFHASADFSSRCGGYRYDSALNLAKCQGLCEIST